MCFVITCILNSYDLGVSLTPSLKHGLTTIENHNTLIVSQLLFCVVFNLTIKRLGSCIANWTLQPHPRPRSRPRSLGFGLIQFNSDIVAKEMHVSSATMLVLVLCSPNLPTVAHKRAFSSATRSVPLKSLFWPRWVCCCQSVVYDFSLPSKGSKEFL